MNKDMKTFIERLTTLNLPIWKRLVLMLALFVIIFVMINLPYFWLNLKYSFVNPQPITIEQTNEAEPKVEPNTLYIEPLGLKLPIIYTSEKNEEAYQRALQKGVVHFPDTAMPGNYGNVYIFGHSSDNAWAPGDYKTAFALLPRIQVGQEIIISDEQGNPYTYRVTQTLVVSPKDLSVLEQGDFKKKLLTLQTSYPIGTALKRFIVRAEIVE